LIQRVAIVAALCFFCFSAPAFAFSPKRFIKCAAASTKRLVAKISLPGVKITHKASAYLEIGLRSFREYLK